MDHANRVRRNMRDCKMNFSRRKAISPIIATVLIIAVTLIAAVAIGGFVFGIFGSASNSAEIQVTSQALVAADFTAGTPAAPTCSVTGAANDITVTNTGTAASSITSVTITYAGVVNTFVPSTGCIVAAAGQAGATTNGNPMSVLFGTNFLSLAAVSGQTYTGTVTMANGAVLIFTGSFQ
jgi:flagellin-like protein